MSRTILHIDMDAFYCAVEERRDPALRSKAFAVGGPSSRSVVASCSYPARHRGVRTAMPSGQARRICPELIFIRGDYEDFLHTSRQIRRILADYSPRLEPLSVDEAWLQVDGDAKAGEAIARALRKRINRELRLPCSIGLSTNKLVAKIASGVGKKRKARYFPLRYPNTLELVPPGEEADYLAPLPIEVIWGIGSRSAPRLHALGIRRIEELRTLSQFTLEREFGASGRGFWERARGIDDSPLITEPSPSKSVGRGRTFPYDLRQESDLREQLRLLGMDVMKRLRGGELRGRVVCLSLRWSDFTSCQRQRRLPALCDDPDTFLAIAQQLFTELWQPGRPVRKLTVRMAACVPKQPASWAGTLWDLRGSGTPQEQDDGRSGQVGRAMMIGGGTTCFHHLV